MVSTRLFWFALALGSIVIELPGSFEARLGQQPDTRSALPYYCGQSDLPTSWKFDNSPLQIAKHAVAFTEDGVSTPGLTLRNRTPRPIVAVAMILDYLDNEDRIIDRVPVAAATDEARSTLRLPFHPVHTFSWTALLPEDTTTLNALNDGIRTGMCPQRAEVTFLWLRFGDGSSSTFSAPEWRLGPVPQFIPPFPEKLTQVITPPMEILASVKVDSSGLVRDVTPESGQQMPGELAAWLKDKWKFHPALLSGKPTESELRVLVEFHAVRAPGFPDGQPITAPVTLIRVFPKAENLKLWETHYGSLGEFSTVP